MKGLKIAVTLITFFLYTPLMIYGSWLLYKHIHATDLMWFIWWISLPIAIILQVIQNVILKALEE